MRVLKFGGTSLADAERIRNLYDRIESNERQIVVCSAIGGATNSLEEIIEQGLDNQIALALENAKSLRSRFLQLITELNFSEKSASRLEEKVRLLFARIEELVYSGEIRKSTGRYTVLAVGELLTSTLVHAYLKLRGVHVFFLPVIEVIRLDEQGEPLSEEIKNNLELLLQANPDFQVYVTQGFICSDSEGEISNLGRGGSDYTASLLGAASGASEIQIWTDIDGMHNNDPRYVDNTRPLSILSFDEAAELAYFGAKIMHPLSILPAREANIPVRILNTFNPNSEGTLISNAGFNASFKAIAAKDGISVINIQSERMLNAYGFLKEVFQIFERHHTSVDMITTAEVAVSLTIDDTANLDSIVYEISRFSKIEVIHHQSIICVVGDFLANTYGRALPILKAMQQIPVRMISYGGSSNNISFVVDTNVKVKALNYLQQSLFEGQSEPEFNTLIQN